MEPLKKIDLNQIHGIAFAIIAAGAIITDLTNGTLFTLGALGYFAPFAALSAVCLFFHHKIKRPISGWLMFAMAAAYIVVGDHGNPTGAVFFCYGMTILASRKALIIGLIVLGVAATARATVYGFSPEQAIRYLVAMGYVIALYFRLKETDRKIALDGLDKETLGIMRLVIKGMSYKEIAPRYETSMSAISKRLERAREKTGARSNEELAIILVKNGHIGIK